MNLYIYFVKIILFSLFKALLTDSKGPGPNKDDDRSANSLSNNQIIDEDVFSKINILNSAQVESYLPGNIISFVLPSIKFQNYILMNSYIYMTSSDSVSSYLSIDAFLKNYELDKFLAKYTAPCYANTKSLEPCLIYSSSSLDFLTPRLVFIGNTNNNLINDILLNRLGSKLDSSFRNYIPISDQVFIKPNLSYQAFLVFLMKSRTEPTYIQYIASTNISEPIYKLNQIYRYKLIYEFYAKNIKTNEILRKYSPVLLSWKIAQNYLCNLSLFEVLLLNSRTTLSCLNLNMLDLTLFKSKCTVGSDRTIKPGNSCSGNSSVVNNFTCVEDTIGFYKCNVTLNLGLNEEYNITLKGYNASYSSEFWSPESVSNLKTLISPPNITITIEKPKNQTVQLNQTTHLTIVSPIIDQTAGFISNSYLFLVKLGTRNYYNTNRHKNFTLTSADAYDQDLLLGLILGSDICSSTASILNPCLLKKFNHSVLDFTKEKSIFIYNTLNRTQKDTEHIKYIQNSVIEADNLYQLFFVFEIINSNDLTNSGSRKKRQIISINITNLTSTTQQVIYFSSEPTQPLQVVINVQNIVIIQSPTTSTTTAISSTTTHKYILTPGTIGVIALSVFILIILIIVSIFLFVCRHNIKKFYLEKKSEHYKKRAVDFIQTVSIEPNRSGSIQIATLNDVSCEVSSNYEISREKLNISCSKKHSDNDYLFQEEFRKLPDYTNLKTTNASDLKINRIKNRYDNIKAYDDTRVMLDSRATVDCNDYINANFIPGYASDKKFIATQGPKIETICDFWSMIEQYDVKVIIMLTNLVENNVAKCTKYWPDAACASETYGHYEITLLNEEIHMDYVKRVFKVFNTKNVLSYNPLNSKIVTQYFYPDWADKDTPNNDLISIFNLIRDVNANFNKLSDYPIVVHCSAGIGRTGCYITLDAMYEKLNVENKIDVFGFVSKIRQCRQQLVQTLKQYIFIHDALNEYSIYGFTDIKLNNLVHDYNNLCEIVPVRFSIVDSSSGSVSSFSSDSSPASTPVGDSNPKSDLVSILKNKNKKKKPRNRLTNGETGIELEFNKINEHISNLYINLCYFSYNFLKISSNESLNILNINKNRNLNITCYDYNRVRLSPSSTVSSPSISSATTNSLLSINNLNESTNSYINATRINLLNILNFADNFNQFILTQDPMENTILDFWKMISEYECNVIVALNKDIQTEKNCVYWPTSEDPIKTSQDANYKYIAQLIHDNSNNNTQHGRPQQAFIKREFKLIEYQNFIKKETVITHFILNDPWPEYNIPNNSISLIELIKQSQSVLNSSTNKSIVIHGHGGGSNCSVFCALNILYNQLKTFHVVDVCRIVRLLKPQRPEMIDNIDHYQFLYDCLVDYIKTNGHGFMNRLNFYN